ncbi:MAG: hypothetical protein JJU02_16200, partial [Cryomorphaceae bacterium]|nr:hypothetical protein [Cryomorphaceae bacterium]
MNQNYTKSQASCTIAGNARTERERERGDTSKNIYHWAVALSTIVMLSFFPIFNFTLYAQIQGRFLQNFRFDCDTDPYEFVVDADLNDFDDLRLIQVDNFFGISNINFNPATNTLDFTGGINDYPGYGKAVFQGMSNSSGDLVNFNAYLIQCCEYGTIPVYDSIWIDDQLSDVLPSGNANNMDVLILGTLQIDIPMNINTSVFEFGTDAGMTLNSDIQLDIFDSEFIAYCHYYWDGIKAFYPSNQILASNSKFTDGLRVFYLKENPITSLETNDFDNNPISIFLEQMTSGGPFGYDSYLGLNGNQFLYSTPYGSHQHHPSSIIDLSYYSSGSSIFSGQNAFAIRAFDCDYVEIGHNSLLTNSFLTFQNDDFTHFGTINSNVRIENNEFQHAYGIEGLNSNIKIGDLTLGSLAENFFLETTINTEGGGITMESNHLFSTPTNLSDASNSSPPGSSHLGIRVENNLIESASPRPFSFIINNTVGSYTKYRVFNNVFKSVALLCSNTNINGSNKLYIDYNTFEPASTLTNFVGYKMLELSFTDGAGVFDNTFTSKTGSEPLADGGTAIYVFHTENAVFHSNNFTTLDNLEHSFRQAFTINSINTGCEYVCNKIEQAYYAFNLENATLSNFGSNSQITLNKFLEDGASFQHAFYG